MKKIKVHSLTGRITLQVMHEAFRAVKRNRGASGVDKVSVQMFEQNLEANLNKLMRELKGGSFRPVPLRRVHIPKGPGSTKTRPLGIPTVAAYCTSFNRVWDGNDTNIAIAQSAHHTQAKADLGLAMTVLAHNR
jgi:hypothetical protein